MIAVGYTMIYGVIQLINFAHGEIFMLGAFFAVTFITFLQLPFYRGKGSEERGRQNEKDGLLYGIALFVLSYFVA